ncbi:MAG: hypothetical protein RTU63_11665 [Candidatus Thorarchaeota archaeon]
MVAMKGDRFVLTTILLIVLVTNALSINGGFNYSSSDIQSNDGRLNKSINDSIERITTYEPATPPLFDSYSVLGNFSLNQANDVDSVGNIAYYALGMHLAIYNVSDVLNPVRLSTLWAGGVVNDIYVTNDTAFLAANEGGISIINVEDPSNPILLGKYMPDSLSKAVHAINNTLYSVSEDEGLEVVDISNVTAPTVLSSWRPGGDFHNIDIKDDIAAIACGDDGSYYVNVSDPHNIQGWGKYEPTGHVYDVKIVGDYAFLQSSMYGTMVVDLSGSYPTYITHRSYYGRGSFDIHDNLVYAPVNSNGFSIINITNPHSLTTVINWLSYDYCFGVSVLGDYACVANQQWGVQIINVTDPYNPEIIHTTNVHSPSKGFEVRGDYCYVADNDIGLSIFDISNPRQPTLISTCRTSDTSWYRASNIVKLIGNTACVSTIRHLYTVNITDPYNPEILDSISPGTNGDFYAMDVEGDYCYLGGNYDFTIYNVTDPSNITEAATYPTLPGTIKSIDVQNSIAYVASSSDGFWSINVSNPNSISKLWSRFPDDSGEDVLVEDDMLYVIGLFDWGDSWELRAFNVSDATNPVEVFTYTLSSYGSYTVSEDIFKYGDILFIGGYDIIVLDISDTGNIRQVSRDTKIIVSLSIQIHDEVIYLSDLRGWWILQHDFDSDGYFSYDEVELGIDPWDPDNDHDGMPPEWEKLYGLDDIRDDANEDLDLDTLTNLEEYNEGTLPNNSDCDEDSIIDGIEVKIYGSNPWSNDTDSDSMWDPYEAAFGLDILTNDTTDDLDGDTLTNIFEFHFGTFPNNTDTESDLMPDDWEIYYHLDPLFDDADEDLDLDNATNIEEYYAGTNPNDHGFRWGVDYGQTLTYELIVDSTVDDVSESLEDYVSIEIGLIEEAPVDVLIIPSADYDAFWHYNLTTCPLDLYFSWEASSVMYFVPIRPALMIGNWTLMGELLDNLPADPEITYSVYETNTTWGYNVTYTTADFTAMTNHTWHKSNGTLQLTSIDVLFTNGDHLFSQLTPSIPPVIEPTTTTPTTGTSTTDTSTTSATITDTTTTSETSSIQDVLDPMILVFVGSGVLGVIVVIVILYMKKK